jgi:hypothetical protein
MSTARSVLTVAGVGVDDAIGKQCDALGHAAQDTEAIPARRIFDVTEGSRAAWPIPRTW